jgi:hypothetical protein
MIGGSSVSIVPGYYMEEQESILGTGMDFFLLYHVQTGSGAHRSSYSVGTRDTLRVRQSESEPNHSPPFTAEILNAWTYTTTRPYNYIERCLIKYRENFTCFRSIDKVTTQ